MIVRDGYDTEEVRKKVDSAFVPVPSRGPVIKEVGKGVLQRLATISPPLLLFAGCSC